MGKIEPAEEFLEILEDLQHEGLVDVFYAQSIRNWMFTEDPDRVNEFLLKEVM